MPGCVVERCTTFVMYQASFNAARTDGCGTTDLALSPGLESPEREHYYGDKLVSGPMYSAPNERPIGMVFRLRSGRNDGVQQRCFPSEAQKLRAPAQSLSWKRLRECNGGPWTEHPAPYLSVGSNSGCAGARAGFKAPGVLLADRSVSDANA